VYRVTEGDKVVAEFPGTRLVTDCPQYHPEAKESDEAVARRNRDVHLITELPSESDPAWTLERLLQAPTIASKYWIHRQYDSTVRTSTVMGPGHADAAVLRIRGTKKALAVKTDCNGRYVFLDPRVGGRIAVAEAARNVACTGATPRAITNCLNFGNPKKPEVFFQFREAVYGMGDACRALETPVTGGNVSLYNENPQGAVYPTPTIGMVGVLEDASHATGLRFTTAGDSIVLLGENTDEIGGSEYLSWVHGVVAGAPPRCDLEGEKQLIDALLEAIRAGHVRSAHDCSEGGLAVALAESCIADRTKPMGAEVNLDSWQALIPRALFFGEAQGRVVVSTTNAEAVLAIAKAHRVPARIIGRVTEAATGLTITSGKTRLAISAERMIDAYHEAIPRAMSRAAAEAVTSDPALAGGAH